MNSLLIIGLLILFLVIILVTIRLWLNQLAEKTKPSQELIAWLQNVSEQVQKSSAAVDQKLTQNINMFNIRLDKAAQVIGDVKESIGKFSEIGHSMQALQQFLQSPKLRGNIGEQILNELLAQNFPSDLYAIQYGFKTGDKVDAVIKTTQGLIPIDAKFPAENFRKMLDMNDPKEQNRYKKLFIQDVKKHIEDISKKYILTNEGTVDYALMYVPSESVYYEVINDPELFDFASNRRILPLSPMSFYAYIKAILMSFEGQRIESQAKEILSALQSIKKDYEKSEEGLSTLTKHITNAYNTLSHFTNTFVNLGQKLETTNTLTAKNKEKLIE